MTALGKLVTVLADPAVEDKHTQTATDSLLRDCPHPASGLVPPRQVTATAIPSQLIIYARDDRL